jgi:anti-sigma regulatory factor (Ser/Thr protein kinase)
VNGIGRIRVGEPDTVELRMAPHPENLALARLALTGVGAVAGASDAEVAELKLAVTEACTNAILHGYGGSAEGELIVRYRVDTAAIEIEIEDDGEGFDPDDPGADSNGEGQGMGLMIIRTITNDVQIESDGSGSRLSFVRRLEL